VSNPYGDAIAFEHVTVLVNTGAQVDVGLTFATWLRVAERVPRGSRLVIPHGPPDGIALEGRRVYRFARPIARATLVWGSLETTTDRTVEVEFGSGEPPDSGAADAPRSSQVLIGRRGKLVTGAVGEVFDYSTFPAFRSEGWDGAGLTALGAFGAMPRAFRVLAHATNANPFTLVVVDGHQASGTVDVLLAEVASTVRPSAVSWATAVINDPGPHVKCGVRLAPGAANVTVSISLWALFD
jgi:hypothetical protein